MPHLDNDDPRCARRVLRSGGFLCRGSEALPSGRKSPVKKGILFDSNDPAGSCPRGDGSACSKTSQSFAAAAAKESLDHFLRRHVRRRKYFSACKRARRPPRRTARALQQAAIPSSKKEYFLIATTPQALARGVTARLVQKPRRVSPMARRKKVSIIFSGDMCGGENTSQAASVEFVCRRRTNYARSRLQPLCQKGILFDSDNPAGDCLRGCLSMTLQAQRSVFLNWDAGELRLRQITPTARPSSRRRAS